MFMFFKRFVCLFVAVCFFSPFAVAEMTGNTGDVDFTLSSTSYFRYEVNENTQDYERILQDDGEFTTYRVRLGLEAKMNRKVRTYFEGQVWRIYGLDTTQFGEGDSKALHLYQGYLEIEDLWGSPFRLRVGRQELEFGSGFLLGTDEFYYGQAYDAVRFDWLFESGMLTVFDAKLIEVAGDPNADDVNLYGLYAALLQNAAVGVDVYGFYYTDRTDTVGLLGIPSKTTTELATFGARAYFDEGDTWDWAFELAYQTGEVFGASDHTGMAFEGTLGRQFDWFDFPQRVGLGLAYYSGDDNPLDDDADFFFSMGQDFHGRYGIFDYFHSFWNASPAAPDATGFVGTAYYGAYILQGNYEINISERWQVRANLISFWTVEDSFSHFVEDYTVDNSAGLEADVIVNFIWNEHLGAEVGLSNLWPGQHFRQTMGSGDNAYRGYVMGIVNW